ncbi:hypothetical protein PG985_010401 [Apiospora marii]|uniref:uncharacterized protein n=1 Tax=Apiospora marii TaxID=335849 RepID=UPI0031302B44
MEHGFSRCKRSLQYVALHPRRRVQDLDELLEEEKQEQNERGGSAAAGVQQPQEADVGGSPAGTQVVEQDGLRRASLGHQQLRQGFDPQAIRDSFEELRQQMIQRTGADSNEVYTINQVQQLMQRQIQDNDRLRIERDRAVKYASTANTHANRMHSLVRQDLVMVDWEKVDGKLEQLRTEMMNVLRGVATQQQQQQFEELEQHLEQQLQQQRQRTLPSGNLGPVPNPNNVRQINTGGLPRPVNVTNPNARGVHTMGDDRAAGHFDMQYDDFGDDF